MSPEERARLAAEYVTLGETLEAINDRRERIKDQLRQESYGERSAGYFHVIVRHNRRLNTGRFTTTYPPEQFPAFYKPVPDTTVIKHRLSGEQVERFYDEGVPVVIVQEPKDGGDQ